MYKVLFAEDELLVRLGLQNSIPWGDFGMELTAQADNGITAYELYQKIRPDVVITDIRMEGMDGYELIRKIREEDPECAIVVISCLDDFETLRKMIPMKIIGYILKASMSMEEIFGVLRETQEYLRSIGRTGEEAPKESRSLEQRLADCFLGEGPEPHWERETSIRQMLLFWLTAEDKEKINELAMKFVYELANRQFPKGTLVETGEKCFCLLLAAADPDSETKAERMNRSVEGFLGVRFQIASETRQKGETLKALYDRLNRRMQEETAEEQGWDKLTREAVSYMREHHRETLSLTEISGVLGISPSYFSHIFKKNTDKNYVEYLNEIRLEAVLKDLKDTDDKVSAIAEKHGFNNQEYFSRVFKKAMGVSPVKWRQQNR
ncbi:MAG: helix-turn-helix domain-containing protein [Eubacteriales bacterium]|nr:helix-turn-helix domain-containing protein [Eubacteriales bacterium]